MKKLFSLFFLFSFWGGLIVAGVCLYYSLLDWQKLQPADAVLRSLSVNSPQNQVIIAEARQNVHRINIFAQGVWFLLGLIWATLGAIGWLRVGGEQK